MTEPIFRLKGSTEAHLHDTEVVGAVQLHVFLQLALQRLDSFFQVIALPVVLSLNGLFQLAGRHRSRDVLLVQVLHFLFQVLRILSTQQLVRKQ